MRISDWSSDVCSSDLTVSGSRQKQAIILEDEQRVARRGGLAKQMFLAEVDAACADRCEAPGIGGPYRAEKGHPRVARSEEHTSELQSLMRISYAVFCLKKKKK